MGDSIHRWHVTENGWTDFVKSLHLLEVMWGFRLAAQHLVHELVFTVDLESPVGLSLIAERRHRASAEGLAAG